MVVICGIDSFAAIPAFSIDLENGSLTTFQQDASKKGLQDSEQGLDRS
jgi:hypothetical protein